MKSNKNVRFKLVPKENEVKKPSNIGKEYFRWAVRSDYVDWTDKFYGFNIKSIIPFVRCIKPRLDEYSSMTWAEIQKHVRLLR